MCSYALRHSSSRRCPGEAWRRRSLTTRVSAIQPQFRERGSEMEATPAAGPTAGAQPYESRSDATAAFAAHVSRGKANTLHAMGVDIVVGEREGARFRDA